MTTYDLFVSDQLALPEPQPVVVLADDDEDIIKLVSYRLERCGYRVISVRNGVEAVRLATELLPSVVVLDVSMPGMTGVEATRALRAAPETAALPIILLTAQTGEAAVAVGTAAGATAYVTKPFSPQELARRVEDLVADG